MDDTQWIMAMFSFLVHFKWRKTIKVMSVPSWKHLQKLLSLIQNILEHKKIYKRT